MQLEQFLELFHPLPGNRYLEVTTQIDEITLALHKKLLEVNGTLKVIHYGHEAPQSIEGIAIESIQSLEKGFRALPRDHDMVIYKNIYGRHKNPKMLLKTAYTTLANTAHIMIIEPKDNINIETLKEELERHEYRAPNAIDVLKNYDLVMAKKMHMWGNGL